MTPTDGATRDHIPRDLHSPISGKGAVDGESERLLCLFTAPSLFSPSLLLLLSPSLSITISSSPSQSSFSAALSVILFPLFRCADALDTSPLWIFGSRPGPVTPSCSASDFSAFQEFSCRRGVGYGGTATEVSSLFTLRATWRREASLPYRQQCRARRLLRVS